MAAWGPLPGWPELPSRLELSALPPVSLPKKEDDCLSAAPDAESFIPRHPFPLMRIKCRHELGTSTLPEEKRPPSFPQHTSTYPSKSRETFFPLGLFCFAPTCFVSRRPALLRPSRRPTINPEQANGIKFISTSPTKPHVPTRPFLQSMPQQQNGCSRGFM
ncbi:hypothetical protein VTK73DRAFT_656 [Phialemonium thermophilum]|uniref:Uncharacterized protein n=1 Tax=Phialemonium thermophilum TaxID=223376 RepID=A0ABR3VUP2_9PEZI